MHLSKLGVRILIIQFYFVIILKVQANQNVLPGPYIPKISLFSSKYLSNLIWSVQTVDQTGPKLSKLFQTCPNLSKLVQTCPNLSKLVQTCPNLSKLEFNKYILHFRYQPIQMCFKVPSFNPGQTFQKVLIQYLLFHYMKVASAKSL